MRNPQGAVFQAGGRVLLRVRPGEDGSDLLRRRLDPSIQTACRSFARRRSCNCCSAISAVREAESWRFADTPPFKDRRTFPPCTIFFPVICPCHSWTGIATASKNYVDKHKSDSGWWNNFDKYAVSLLKAYYGDAATAENEFGFGWLPRVTGDHSHIGYWLEMAEGKVEGLFVMGQNPAVGAPNSGLERRALAKLKWLVVRDLVATETASFWYDSPEIRSGEMRPESIDTEVFFFPGAGRAEKEGCFTNTQRLNQFHEKAVEPPGDARSESWFMYHLGRRLKERASANPQPRNAGLNALNWTYPTVGPLREPAAEEVLKEINGYTVADRKLVQGYKEFEGRRVHSVRLLDLFGHFPESGGEPRSQASAEGRTRSRLGLGVAERPAHSL